MKELSNHLEAGKVIVVNWAQVVDIAIGFQTDYGINQNYNKILGHNCLSLWRYEHE